MPTTNLMVPPGVAPAEPQPATRTLKEIAADLKELALQSAHLNLVDKELRQAMEENCVRMRDVWDRTGAIESELIEDSSKGAL
jgi:hypothetical protein